MLAAGYSISPIGIYIFNLPGRIEMTASPDGGGVTINGTVEDPRVSVVAVNTNGVNSSEPVVGGTFSLQIPISQTPTVITVSAGGTTAVLNVPPQIAPPVTNQTPASIRVLITAPVTDTRTAAATATVEGTVEGQELSSVDLVVNDSPRPAQVSGGRFSSEVELRAGENTISARWDKFLSNEVIVVRMPRGQIELTQPQDNYKTASTTVNVSGRVQDLQADKVTLYVNDQEAGQVQIQNGQFSGNVTLSPGPNTIQAKAPGADSNSITVTLAVPPPSPTPAIAITYPADNSVSKVSSIRIAGSVKNLQATNLTIYVNGQPTSTVQIAGGQFSANVLLSKGPNTILAEASGVTSKAITVTLAVTPPPPTAAIAITYPADNSVSKVSSIRIAGSVKNLQATNLTIHVNGQPRSTAQIAGSQFSANVLLTPGPNTIQAKAPGVDSNLITVTFGPLAPKVVITYPVTGMKTGSATIAVNGIVENVASATVTLSVNNVSQIVQIIRGGFSASAKLNPGKNTLRASIGRIVSDTVLVYSEAAQPIVRILSPLDGSSTQNRVISVSGEVSNSPLNAVTVYVNDQPGKPVQLTKGTFTTIVSIRPGVNTIYAKVGNVPSHLIRITLKEGNLR
jgi:hypothetical protein